MYRYLHKSRPPSFPQICLLNNIADESFRSKKLLNRDPARPQLCSAAVFVECNLTVFYLLVQYLVLSER